VHRKHRRLHPVALILGYVTSIAVAALMVSTLVVRANTPAAEDVVVGTAVEGPAGSGAGDAAADPAGDAATEPYTSATAAPTTPAPSIEDQLAAEAQKAADAKAAADAAAQAEAEAEAAAKAEAEAEAKAAEEQAAEEQARREAAEEAADPKAVARAMLADYGWSDDQFSCLDSLWTRESNWDHTATNPSSGAYGIPQALPASKMGTVADDYRTNPITQITWGLGYIDDRYGTPCGAWGHSQSVGWY
jgi:hypothetical protein